MFTVFCYVIDSVEYEDVDMNFLWTGLSSRNR